MSAFLASYNNIQAVSHSLSHRGPSASRARSRWQPYSSNGSLSAQAPPLRSSPSPSTTTTTTIAAGAHHVYLNSPASSVSSASPPSSILQSLSCETSTSDHHIHLVPLPSQPLSQSTSTSSPLLREAQKARYVTRLVDQAIKSLCDIWHPDDIPRAFYVPPAHLNYVHVHNASVINGVHTTDINLNGGNEIGGMRNTQLPSPPVSPRTGACSSASPAAAPPASVHAVRATATVPTDHFASTHVLSTRSSASTHTPIQSQRPTQTRSETIEADRDAHRASIKAFVHEVLRRSRTSTGVLQTALCYLEAVKVKVPGLQMQMREVETECIQWTRSAPAGRAAFKCGSESMDQSMDGTGLGSRSGDDTMEVEDAPARARTCAPSPPPSSPALSPQQSLRSSLNLELAAIPQFTDRFVESPPTPDPPNPLLCPRRTFLASLILASKFTQDRTYSNRAWARLAGLEPREVGRCERALGEALEWRLWVGRGVVAEREKTNQSGRAVGRTRSDGDLRGPLGYDAGLNASAPALVRAPARMGNLQRSATVPNLDSNPDPNFNFDPNVNFNYNANANANANWNASGPLTWWRESDSSLYGPETDTRTPANTNANTYTLYDSPYAPSTTSSTPTPTLTSSPTSSVSSASSGERTVLMGGFLEVPSASTLGGPGAGCGYGCACGYEGSGYACRIGYAGSGYESAGYGCEYGITYGNESVGCAFAPPPLPSLACGGDVDVDGSDLYGRGCGVFVGGVGGVGRGWVGSGSAVEVERGEQRSASLSSGEGDVSVSRHASEDVKLPPLLSFLNSGPHAGRDGRSYHRLHAHAHATAHAHARYRPELELPN